MTQCFENFLLVLEGYAMLTTSGEDVVQPCLAHVLAHAVPQCSYLCLARGALGTKDSPETFSVLTRFAALIARMDEQGRFSALDCMVARCFERSPSVSWLGQLLSVTDPILSALTPDALLEVMLQHHELCSILLAGVDKVLKKTAPCNFVPLPELNPANVLDRLRLHTGTGCIFKQTKHKALYMPQKSMEMTVEEWLCDGDRACYLSDLVADPRSLGSWRKSCAVSLYFHYFDLHAVIAEASKTRFGNQRVKAIIPPNLEANFYLFFRDGKRGGHSESDNTVGTMLHQDGYGSMFSLHTSLVGDNLVNVHELRHCLPRIIGAAQRALLLDRTWQWKKEEPYSKR
jgi:hypothetical protein